jgi:hypothetical protein
VYVYWEVGGLDVDMGKYFDGWKFMRNYYEIFTFRGINL